MASPASPGMGGLDYLTLAPPQPNIMLLVTLIIAAVAAVDGAIAVIVIVTGGHPRDGYGRSATSPLPLTSGTYVCFREF